MRMLCPLLTNLLFLVPLEASLGDAPAARSQRASRFAQDSPAQQRQFVGQMLTRLDRANRLVLSADEAAKIRAPYALLRQQMVRSKPLSEDRLAALVREVDRREKDAVTRLVRQFRVRVYQTFRLNRDRFTQRRLAWDRVQGLWEAAGGPTEQQHRLIDWLQLAIRNSSPASIGPLPADPVFEPRKSAAVRAIAEARVVRDPVERFGGPGTIRPPEPATGPAERNPRALVVKPSDPPPAGLAGLPEIPDQSPRRAPRRELSRQEPVSHPASPPSSATALRRAVEPAAAMSRPLPAVTPPAASQPPISQEPKLRVGRVEVNVGELTARIAGANLALRALESELDEEPRQWDARRLAPLVRRLRILIVQSNDLAIVRDLLSGRRRELVGRRESPQGAISQLAAGIYRARTHVLGPDFSGTPAQQQAELQRLDTLSRELAELDLGK